MNEPDNGFASCGQEGMAVPVTQRAAVVQAVGEALARIAPHSKVIADESSLAYFQTVPEVPQWLRVPGTARWLAVVAHHAYDYPSSSMLTGVARLGAQFKKPVWMTEICCFNGQRFGPQFDPTILSGLWLADTMWSDLAAAEDSAFYWWTALSSQLGCDPATNITCMSTPNANGWNDGLLYYDPRFATHGNYSIYPTKRFYVMGNFSRYVRPGAVRHPVSGAPAGIRALAFAKGGGWTVIVINDDAGSAAANLRITFPSQGSGLTASSAEQTSASADLASVPLPRRDVNGGFVTKVPPQSVTTFGFETH
jgi:O-glycosyl hydrolase